MFLSVVVGFESYRDHYIISTKVSSVKEWISCVDLMSRFNFKPINYTVKNTLAESILKKESSIEYLLTSRYSFETSQYILLPQYSFIRLLIYSFDVIHTLGCYSIGIKIDAIPGRINLATTVRLLNGGECRGNCFESCFRCYLKLTRKPIKRLRQNEYNECPPIHESHINWISIYYVRINWIL